MAYITTDDKMQSMAEKDMALIRSKRATNTGLQHLAMPKGKYRKRSVCLGIFAVISY